MVQTIDNVVGYLLSDRFLERDGNLMQVAAGAFGTGTLLSSITERFVEGRYGAAAAQIALMTIPAGWALIHGIKYNQKCINDTYQK